jgi:hypothetical protein
LRIAHPDDPRSDALLRFLQSEQGRETLTSAGYAPLIAQ